MAESLPTAHHSMTAMTSDDQLEGQVVEHILAQKIDERLQHGLAFRSIRQVFFVAEALQFMRPPPSRDR